MRQRLLQEAGQLRQRHARRLGWFALVGGSGVFVNSAVLLMLVEFVGLPKLLAAALATESAILSNFLLNNCLTFRSAPSRHTIWLRALRYNLFALGGMVISLLVLALLMHGLDLHYFYANLFGIAAGMFWNYLANSRWNWSITE